MTGGPRAALAVVLALLAQGAVAAEIGLRPDLRPRLEQMVPIYDDTNNLFAFGPIVPRPANPQDTYLGGLRVIGVSGVIEPGDTARLATLIGPAETAAPFVVVFDSPGGNFVEGVRMGEALQPFRGGNGDPLLYGVIVLEEAHCMSACAVAFALAALPRDSRASVRYVELGARLGFHMPFVPTDQQTVRTEIAQAMDLTYEVMAEYMQLIGNGLAPTALVQNALHYRRPEDFFLLRGGLLTRFMDFVPVAGPRGATPLAISGLTERDALSMCQILTYSQGSRMTADDYEWWPINAYGEQEPEATLTDLFTRMGARRLALDGCTIEWQEGDSLGLLALGDCGRDYLSGGWCASPKDPFDPPLPAATGALLADSLGCHGGALTRSYYRWDARNAFLEEEEPAEYRWSGETDPDMPRQRFDWGGARLAANVNLRAAPGGDVLTRWTEGTEVAVLDCALSADDQGVWYHLASGSASGWASARYVDVPALARWDQMIRPAGVE
jgi:hypothetical protein